jgi:predicted ATPase with chaperone activity
VSTNTLGHYNSRNPKCTCPSSTTCFSSSTGAGKTLLAQAVPGILPRITIEEVLEVTRINSIADQLPPDVPLIYERSFRALHHTISHACQ